MMLKHSVSSFFYERFFPWLGVLLINALFMTIRMRWFNDAFVFEHQRKNKPLIFAFWHNRLLYMPYASKYRLKKHKLVALTSRSKDGRLIGNIIRSYDLVAVHGSTTRGGSEALRELIRYAKEQQYDCAITPDGPRGPKYIVQPGIVSLAQATELDIVPVSYDFRHKIRLKSWDGFYIPLPFTWGVFLFGDPLKIPVELTEDERENWKTYIADAIHSVSNEAKQWIAENRRL